MKGLMLLKSIVTGVLGFFTTTDRAKKEYRLALVKEVLQHLKHNKKDKRSVMGWVLLLLTLAGIVADIIVTGGDNLELLMVIFSGVGGL